VGPIVEEIATEKADIISVGKLNIEEQGEIAQKYHVMSIPTLILFKDGENVAVSVGAVPKDEILRRIEPSF
jgi:thioredoxin 1